MEVNLTLPDGRLLIGSVPGVRGATIVRCMYSSLSAKHRVAAWVRCLALSASRPELPVSAVTIGRGPKRRGEQLVRLSTVGPLAADPESRAAVALAALGWVVDLYDRGMREPLPLYCATSSAWAEARRNGSDSDDAANRARQQWEGSYTVPGERADPGHVMVLGREHGFDSVMRPSPASDECGRGWADGEPHRFGRLSRRIWDPLLLAERLEDR
jgi:exodeoxyribonuclease V gamma subunit